MAAADEAVESVREFPESAPPWRPGHPARKHRLRRFPYLVIYRLIGSDLEIVAFAHDKPLYCPRPGQIEQVGVDQRRTASDRLGGELPEDSVFRVCHHRVPWKGLVNFESLWGRHLSFVITTDSGCWLLSFPACFHAPGQSDGCPAA